MKLFNNLFSKDTSSKILLLEDNSSILNFLVSNLEENGWIVKASKAYLSGITEVRNFQPDLVVIDNSMQQLNLQEWVDHLSMNNKLQKTPVLFIVNQYDYKKTVSISKPSNHYIMKSVRPKVLLSVIRGLINKERTDWILKKQVA